MVVSVAYPLRDGIHDNGTSTYARRENENIVGTTYNMTGFTPKPHERWDKSGRGLIFEDSSLGTPGTNRLRVFNNNQLPSHISWAQGWTVSFWIYVPTPITQTDAFTTIYNFGDIDTFSQFLRGQISIDPFDDGLFRLMTEFKAAYDFNDQIKLSYNQWHHVTIVMSEDSNKVRLRFYNKGQYIGTTLDYDPITQPAYGRPTFYVGRWRAYTWETDPLMGFRFFYLRVYDTALSAQEVLDAYENNGWQSAKLDFYNIRPVEKSNGSDKNGTALEAYVNTGSDEELIVCEALPYFADFERGNRYTSGDTTAFERIWNFTQTPRIGFYTLWRKPTVGKAYRTIWDSTIGRVANAGGNWIYRGWVLCRSEYDTADLAGLCLSDGNASNGFQFGIDIRNGFFLRKDYSNSGGVVQPYSMSTGKWYKVQLTRPDANTIRGEAWLENGTKVCDISRSDGADYGDLFLGVAAYHAACFDEIEFGGPPIPENLMTIPSTWA